MKKVETVFLIINSSIWNIGSDQCFVNRYFNADNVHMFSNNDAYEIASVAYIIGEEKQLNKPREHLQAGKDYLAFARRLKQIGLDNGIVCNQSHAPFPTCCAEIRSYYKLAIECTA